MVKKLSYLIILLFSISGNTTCLAGITAKEIVDKVKQKYESLQTLAAEFEQIFQWKLAGETQTLEGKICLAQKDKYRIETQDQTIVTDGQTVWTYSKVNRQVIIDHLAKSQENPLPRDMLFQYSKDYEPKLLGEEKLNNQDCYVLQLSSKTEDRYIREMKVWVEKDTWIVRKIEHADINENLNTYIIKKIDLNPKLDDAIFTFEIPKGMEVVDLR
ncbi:MAG: outer membrane lipoprotein carrier protein LolA [candidate division KSB1 bacterium]|nr:outer membrane lipoprotein carrier protein LolA [candidate division KSB1 bacterium]